MRYRTGMRALGTGEMSRLTGLSLKALRLYDANGLLAPAEVDERTGYRRYAPDQIDRGRTIAALRRADLPLTLIAELLDADPDLARARLRSWWTTQRHDFASRGLEIDRVTIPPRPHARSDPDASLRAPSDLAALVREEVLPDRAIASIVRTVAQPELVPTFLADVVELRRHLVSEGATPSAEHWVLFHSAVAAETSGRIETAVPFEGRATPTRRIGLRVEPAARYAVIDVRAREVGYPRLLEFYDAVRDAGSVARPAAGGGLAPWRPPREWYPGAWPDEGDGVAVRIAMPLGRGDPVDSAPGAEPRLRG
ncbi:MerR family transcriptional regulator [Agromyces soli]